MEKNSEKDLLIKAPKTTKAQIIGVSIFALCVVLAVVALIIVIVLNSNKTIPDQVKFVENGKEISVQAKANDNFSGYRFKFVDSAGQQEFTFDANTNVLLISDKEEIKIGRTYSVSVCYTTQPEGGNSEYSKPVTWQAYKFLDTPTGFNLDLVQNRLTWEQVADADYYYVHYITDTFNTIKCSSNYLDLTLQQLPAGQYDVTVSAISDKSYLKDSYISSEQQVIVRKELSEFDSAVRSDETITIRSKDIVEFIEVKVEGEEEIKRANPTILGIIGRVTYSINIAIYNLESGKTIYVRPGSSNEYITYNGEWTQVTQSNA